MINGDLKIQAYSAPGQPAESFELRQHFWVERPPMGIFGLAEENATQGGVVWLEVNYAKRAQWTDTPTWIEEPTYIK